MSDATTAIAEPSLRRVDLNAVTDALPLHTTRAGVIVAVARALVGSSVYAPGGRGLTGINRERRYDDIGFVRACFMAARNWRASFGECLADTSTIDLSDLPSRPNPGPRAVQFSHVALVELLQGWGLVRQGGGHPFSLLPGDIVVSLGDPGLTIVTAAGTPDRSATYAGVWPGETVTEGPYRDWSRRPPGQFWRMPEVV